jgi:hypothetical protein
MVAYWFGFNEHNFCSQLVVLHGNLTAQQNTHVDDIEQPVLAPLIQQHSVGTIDTAT